MMDNLLLNTATRVFSDICTPALKEAGEEGHFSTEAWALLVETGLVLANTSEDRGGVGASAYEMAEILRIAGSQALPLPLPEVFLAETALSAAGLPPAETPLTVAPAISGERLEAVCHNGAWTVRGTLHMVPWGRHLDIVTIAATCDGPLTVVLRRPAEIKAGMNLANEPRDRVTFMGAEVLAAGEPGKGLSATQLYLAGALARSVQTVGAMERIRDLTVEYAQARQQFGRPLAKFQAVQQQIAVLASQVAACQAAVDGAVEASAAGPATFEIAAAKAVTGEATGTVAAIAHQIHGAMGFTHEYPLHLNTRRIWSWREEFGTEAEWQRWIGRNMKALGGAGIWPFLSAKAKNPPVEIDA
ncbi:acyl-CoA dehydrogenase family protein [Chelativorans multitrophicus]|jgi:alkylation response protein AidB-like acyl-CoA dehydrogenase|uniref:Acyl-CoA dehydrogenase-like protein n=2 Tax=Chelativorans TaxID=449972 RepID=Q11D75_CHESB|nr:acyl-CoA dehydrogenase family protein [Chelativorans multitrophicus]